MADRMMNRGCFRSSFLAVVRDLFDPDYIMRYLRVLRKRQYYSQQGNPVQKLCYLYYRARVKKLGIKLGFTIGNCFGYGLSIPHWGTIVAFSKSIGNYAVLQTSTCVSAKDRIIGDGLYVGTGAKITTGENLGDGVTVAANSVVSKGCEEGYALLAGIPAEKKGERKMWYEQEGGV